MNRNHCFAEFAKYASLNVLSMLGLSCYILADTFLVAKGLGTNGLAALNLSIPIYSFIHGSGLMLGLGGAIWFSILRGQSQPQKANQMFSAAVWLALALGAVFFAVGAFASGTLATLLGADASVFAMTKTYLQVILLFAPLFICNNVMLAFVTNDGNPRLSMLATVSASLTNIVLDYVFIFNFGMGIFGAAFATGIAPVVSLSLLSLHRLKGRNGFHLVRQRVAAADVARIVTSGLPSLITEGSAGVVMIVFNTLVLRMSGNTGVAAYGIIANLSLVVLAMFTGIGQGMQPLVSQSHGMGDQNKCAQVFRYALAATLGLSLLIYCGVFLGAEGIVALFNSENDAQLRAIAVQGIKIYFVGCLFAGLNIVTAMRLTASEQGKSAQIISILRGIVLMLPLAILLSLTGQVALIWYAFVLTELLACGASFLLYRRKFGHDNSSATP